MLNTITRWFQNILSERPMTNIYILVGPSGAGKSELLKRALLNIPQMKNPVSHTTRSQRAGEVAGQDYVFITEEWFKDKQNHKEFCEVVEYDGQFYGYERSRVKDALGDGDVMLVTGADGADQIKNAFPGRVMTIFVEPPNPSVLRQRMEQRGDDAATIERRLAVVSEEMRMGYYAKCSAIIYPDDIETMFMALAGMIERKRAEIATIS